MIVIRNVFQLKFGRAREATSMMKEGADLMRKAGGPGPSRVLTDIAGNFYTLVLENNAASLAEWENSFKVMQNSPELQAWYRKFTELCVSGYREIYTVVE